MINKSITFTSVSVGVAAGLECVGGGRGGGREGTGDLVWLLTETMSAKHAAPC